MWGQFNKGYITEQAHAPKIRRGVHTPKEDGDSKAHVRRREQSKRGFRETLFMRPRDDSDNDKDSVSQ